MNRPIRVCWRPLRAPHMPPGRCGPLRIVEIAGRPREKRRLCTLNNVNSTSVRLDTHLAHSLPEEIGHVNSCATCSTWCRHRDHDCARLMYRQNPSQCTPQHVCTRCVHSDSREEPMLTWRESTCARLLYRQNMVPHHVITHVYRCNMA